MAHVCRNCDYFDESGTYTASCPTCGGNMRLTLLDPRATATATLDPPADRATEDRSECWRGSAHDTGTQSDWGDLYAYGYEEIEAPWTFRYAQIGAGVGAYFFVWRWGGRFLTSLSIASLDGPADENQIMVLGIGGLILNCAAALFGGGAAGIWAKNWILQSLGVATGVFAIPLVGMLVFAPESWPMFCISLAATSVLTMLGAYLGHLLVKPTRVPIS